jgi:hypothetical protein
MEREMEHKEFMLIKLLLFANCFLFFSCISSMNVIKEYIIILADASKERNHHINRC